MFYEARYAAIMCLLLMDVIYKTGIAHWSCFPKTVLAFHLIELLFNETGSNSKG
jgi:hypothetical protein